MHSPHKISLQIELDVAPALQGQLRQRIEGLIQQLLPDSSCSVQLHSPAQQGLELHFLGQAEVWWNGQKLNLRQRFNELLAVLALHPDGLSSEQVSQCIYGDDQNSGCSRIELARLRQLIPIESRPYRLVAVQADFLQLHEHLYGGRIGEALKLYRGPLLPLSGAPAILEARQDLEETIRRTVLMSRDPDHLWTLASTVHDDLELWEIALDYLPLHDSRRALAETQRGRIAGGWKVA